MTTRSGITTSHPSVPSALRRPRLKLVALALGGVVAVSSTLTACQTKVGAAAVVMGQRITSDDVNKYVGGAAASSSAAAAGGDAAGSAALSLSDRRLLVLNSLIGDKLYGRALEVNGGPATAAERSAALTQGLAGETEADLTSKIVAAGLPAAFEPVYVSNFEERLVLATRLNITTQPALDAALSKVAVPVSVSSRYGTWSEDQHAVVGFVAPNYLLPLPTPTPAPAAGA